MTTNFYIDVDGVINIFPYNPLDQHPDWDDVTDTIVRGYRIAYSPTVLRSLESYAERSDVSAHWLTTWCDAAVTDLCPAIGLLGEEWPVVGDAERRDHGYDFSRWWKLSAIKTHIETTKPDKVVWIDDDLRVAQDAVNWLNDVVPESDFDVLAIAPLTGHALQKKHFDKIDEFLG